MQDHDAPGSRLAVNHVADDQAQKQVQDRLPNRSVKIDFLSFRSRVQASVSPEKAIVRKIAHRKGLP